MTDDSLCRPWHIFWSTLRYVGIEKCDMAPTLNLKFESNMKDKPKPGTKKILVVDDEPLILFGLSNTMVDLGEVKTVRTGEEACTEIHSCFYDLCFLDVYLPGKSGIEVMQEIHKKSPETKVVMMSAYMDDENKKKIADKTLMLLEKPFNLAYVKSIARQALM